MLGVTRQGFERETETARQNYATIAKVEVEEPLSLGMGVSGRVVSNYEERPQPEGAWTPRSRSRHLSSAASKHGMDVF